MEIELPLQEYADDIIITPYIVSTEEQKLSSNEHHGEFNGVDISVPKGAILAIGNEHKITLDMLSTLTAAISLIPYSKIDEDKYEINLDDDRINIRLNPTTKLKVERVRSTNNRILFPALYMTALTHAIANLENNDNKKWSKSLSTTLEKCKVDKRDMKEQPYKCAQLLLENPLRYILTQGMSKDE